jgi:hypothetical protein
MVLSKANTSPTSQIAKRKPKYLKGKLVPDDDKPSPPPKRFVAFSTEDTTSIEAAYQKSLEALEDQRAGKTATARRRRWELSKESEGPNTSLADDEHNQAGVRVPVNEDFLFDVDLERRELAPAYWLGPVYEVRRGSWFYQEGSVLRPCEENLAAQLEEGYLKVRPWTYPGAGRGRSNSAAAATAKDVTPKASVENLKAATAAANDAGTAKTATTTGNTATTAHTPQTYRLFGTWMNNVATYQDANTAWLSSDGMLSWVTSTMYERFGGGAYMSGVKLVRGYTKAKEAKEVARPSTPTGTKSAASTTEAEELEKRAQKRRSAPPTTRSSDTTDVVEVNDKEEAPSAFIKARTQLTRQLSNLMETDAEEDEAEKKAAADEEIRQREEKEIQDDYNARQGETQGREIEHLVLITHGIGQLLGLRMESVNFVHDVNVMRKTLKSVYSTSDDLRALNAEVGKNGPGNSKVQVLPVCWRHLLDFPKRREKKASTRAGERDIGDKAAAEEDEEEYPSLEDITVEGVAFARSLVSDLALDVLLYQSGYRETIAEIVVSEANRIYKLFKDRNPEFRGKVHVMGHSLGSAIMFDILCRQKEKAKEAARNPLRFWSGPEVPEPTKDPRELVLDFEVEDFYCLGSPIGLFQMLKGRTISARHLPNALPTESPFDPETVADPFLNTQLLLSPQNNNSGDPSQRVSPITNLPFTISSPKAAQLFNIFHPSDPIAYRIEPLISPAMATLKPQVLPYTKKGIFGTVAPQGLTGIGAKVGQSVSGLWSSFSASLASSLLNRSLGLSQEDVATITASQQSAQTQTQTKFQHPRSPGAGTNIGAGVLSPESQVVAMTDVQRAERAAERKRQLARETAARKRDQIWDVAKDGRLNNISGNDATLLDDELETLFSQFERKRIGGLDGSGTPGAGEEKAIAEGSAITGGVEGTMPKTPKEREAERRAERERLAAEERKAQRLRREEMKVRALNRNGRVDYSIQE